MTIQFLPEAEAELDQAVAYYREHGSGLDAAFTDAIRQALTRIEERPHAWPKSARRTRRYRLTRFPYGIVYAPLPERIVIVAVMHLHRHPNYWRERLKQISAP